jgi:hypothetical protein
MLPIRNYMGDEMDDSPARAHRGQNTGEDAREERNGDKPDSAGEIERSVNRDVERARPRFGTPSAAPVVVLVPQLELFELLRNAGQNAGVVRPVGPLYPETTEDLQRTLASAICGSFQPRRPQDDGAHVDRRALSSSEQKRARLLGR